MPLSESEARQLADKEAHAEKVWAEKRTFYQPGIPQKPIIREYGVQRLSNGAPVAHMMPTLGQEKELAESQGERYNYRPEVQDGHKVYVDSNGARFDTKGRRIMANRRDEELAMSQGAVRH